jgi:hypothetical protein
MDLCGTRSMGFIFKHSAQYTHFLAQSRAHFTMGRVWERRLGLSEALAFLPEKE